MTRWLMLPLLALLTACVSYYQPESALEDGVYYAENDPGYRYNTDDFYYARAVVYPWSSIDSFYFGYWPYPSYSYGYWPYPIYGFNVVYPNEPGFAAGYYAFYSPWYWRGYSTFYAPVWRPYRDNCAHHQGCGKHANDERDDGDDRYAGDGGQNSGYPGSGGEENAFYSNNVRNKMSHGDYPRGKGYVSTTPAGRTGYHGEATQNPALVNAGQNRSKSVYPRSKDPVNGRNPATVSAQGNRMTPPAGTFSGPGGQSPSFNAPSHSRSSGFEGISSRHKDRD